MKQKERQRWYISKGRTTWHLNFKQENHHGSYALYLTHLVKRGKKVYWSLLNKSRQNNFCHMKNRSSSIPNKLNPSIKPSTTWGMNADNIEIVVRERHMYSAINNAINFHYMRYFTWSPPAVLQTSRKWLKQKAQSSANKHRNKTLIHHLS